MNNIDSLLKEKFSGKRIYTFHDIIIVSDEMNYKGTDQVIPLFPEQQFFLDELDKEKIGNANVLEIGLGSGVLSIGSIKAGAKKVVGLEINPRAKNLAGFNIVLNGLEGKIEIKDGNERDIWKPVENDQFDYIISNPPFVPIYPNAKRYIHSDAGLYGIDFLVKIFRQLDNHLSKQGCAQIVTAAPGDNEGPFMLFSLIEKYLTGSTTVKINPVPLHYDYVLELLLGTNGTTQPQIEEMKKQAINDGVSYWHLCVIHYERGENNINAKYSKAYQNWEWEL